MTFRWIPALLLGSVATTACGARVTDTSSADLPAVCSAPSTHQDEGAAFPARAQRLPALVPEQPTPILIHNARVLTATGVAWDTGWLRFEDGRITALGEGAPDADARTGAQPIDADGRWLTPGLIDTHSHLGVYATPSVTAHSDGNEATAPTTAGVEAVHSVWTQDPGFERAIAGGVTTLHILPGSANLIGGRGFTMKNRRGALHAEEVRFPGAPETVKMACGENPKRVYGGRGAMPSTRMGSLAVMRQTFTDARRYLDASDRYHDRLTRWCEQGAPADTRPDAPPIQLASETLAGVLRGTVLPQVHCYRSDDMLSFLQLADEFGFQVRSFHHAIEAYKIRDDLAARDISISTWADWWGFKMEALDTILEAPGLLHAAGARAVIHSDSEIGIQRLHHEAAKSYYASVVRGIELTHDDALQWITRNAAWTLGVDHRTGTLEVGKDADLVIWSHDPFSIYAAADLVFIDGVLEHERAQSNTPWSDFELGRWPSTLEVRP